MKNMKRQKDMTLKDEPCRAIGGHYTTEEEHTHTHTHTHTPEKMKRLSQSGNEAQLWMCLVVKVQSNAVKNTILLKNMEC